MQDEGKLRQMAATFPKTGDLFEGRYRIGPMIGAGGFARVYKAQQEDLGREVALKIMTPPKDGDYDPHLVERFNQEARLVSRLRDPHTITMFDYGRNHDGLLYMVFEYVNGVSLSHLISAEAPLRADRAMKILRQTLSSLEEAHAMGMLHRDIKPGNIMVFEHVGRPDQVKLLDFGIAKLTGADHPAQDLTADGALIGTPRYMSPEQIRGEKLTAQSDLYSLGLVAYEMLMGKKAIESNSSVTIIGKQLDPQSFTLPVLAHVPAGLRTWVNRLLAKEREHRFKTATEALQGLNALENGKAYAAPVDDETNMLPTNVLPTNMMTTPPEYEELLDISNEIMPVDGTQERRWLREAVVPQVRGNTGPMPAISLFEEPARRPTTGSLPAVVSTSVPTAAASPVAPVAYEPAPAPVQVAHPAHGATQFPVPSASFVQQQPSVYVQAPPQAKSSAAPIVGGIVAVLAITVGLLVFSSMKGEPIPAEPVAVVATPEVKPEVVEPAVVEKVQPRRFVVRTVPANLSITVNGRPGTSPAQFLEDEVEFPLKVRVRTEQGLSPEMVVSGFVPDVVYDATEYLAMVAKQSPVEPVVTEKPVVELKEKVTKTGTRPKAESKSVGKAAEVKTTSKPVETATEAAPAETKKKTNVFALD